MEAAMAVAGLVVDPQAGTDVEDEEPVAEAVVELLLVVRRNIAASWRT